MNSYNELIGLPIYSTDSQKSIGIVNDIFFDSKKKILMGIIVEKRKFLGVFKYIPIDEIEKIEKTCIYVRTKESVKSINQNDSLYKMVIDLNNCTIDTEVFNDYGKKIGLVNDIIFDFEIGTIDSYVITNGLLEDFISGRKTILDENVQIRLNKIYEKYSHKINERSDEFE